MKSRDKIIDSDDFIKMLGFQLGKIDHLIMAILAKRMGLAELVEEFKHRHGDQPILRKEIEDGRLAQAARWAEEKGLNPNFTQTLLYLVISESCRVQIGKLQTRPVKEDNLFKTDKEAWYRLLKKNLLELAANFASKYKKKYGDNAPFATSSYLDFEETVLKREINALKGVKNLDLAVDLGCAAGRLTFQMAPDFKNAIGYDISPDMISKAKSIRISGTNFSKFRNTDFEELDIEKGIPLDDKSASLVVMNLGTASDVRDIQRIIAEIKRILKKDGRFILSFYNSGALFYQWFIPWPVSLTAEIDLIKHCLNVRLNGKTFQVYAKPYTVREVKQLLARYKELVISPIQTYPTIAAILPDEFFKEEESKEAIKVIDNQLASTDKGAYILVTGKKISD